MKKIGLTGTIIICGIAAAVAMLLNAFAPGVYGFLANKTLMLVMLGLAIFLAPAKRPDWKCFATQLVVLAVLGVAAWGFALLEGFGYLTIALFGALGALLITLLGHGEFSLSVGLAAASAAVYSAGSIQKFLLIAAAYAVGYAALNGKKTNLLQRAVLSAIICLAFCAFR